MIIDKNHKDFDRYDLCDSWGHVIPNVISYNTETGETEIVIRNEDNKLVGDNGGVLVAKAVIKHGMLMKDGELVL